MAQNREWRLDRHQRMMTKMGQAKEIFDQIFLPEKPAVEREDELMKSVNDIPDDAQLISAFMIFVDDIYLNYAHDEDKFIKICRCLKIIFSSYPREVFIALDKLGGEIAARNVKKVKKPPSKTKGYM
jgi:hypothetical protein